MHECWRLTTTANVKPRLHADFMSILVTTLNTATRCGIAARWPASSSLIYRPNGAFLKSSKYDIQSWFTNIIIHHYHQFARPEHCSNISPKPSFTKIIKRSDDTTLRSKRTSNTTSCRSNVFSCDSTEQLYLLVARTQPLTKPTNSFETTA